MPAIACSGGLDDGQSPSGRDAGAGGRGGAMPPPLLERLALELRILVLVVFLVFGLWTVPAEHVELQTQQHADRCFNRADLGRTQQHQYVDKLKLVDIPRRLRRDRPRRVGRAFRQLSPGC